MFLQQLLSEISTKFDNNKEHRHWISKKNFKHILEQYYNNCISQSVIETYHPPTIVYYLKSLNISVCNT